MRPLYERPLSWWAANLATFVGCAGFCAAIFAVIAMIGVPQ